MSPKELTLARMEYHKLQAQWWMHAATNGFAETRKLFHAFGNREFTNKEKRNDAMKISQNHMKIYMELLESLVS